MAASAVSDPTPDHWIDGSQFSNPPAFTFGGLIQEDWGWEFHARSGGVSLRIAIGIMDDSVGSDYPEWRILVERPRFNLIKKLFGTTDDTVQSRLLSAIDAVLYEEPAITEIEWCDDKDQDRAPHPLDVVK